MIKIAITVEAFKAIAAMLASGNVLYERERTAQGGYLVWLDETVVNNLERLRGRATRTSAPSSSGCSASRPTSRSPSCFAVNKAPQKRGRK
jgi:hypothetical protein